VWLLRLLLRSKLPVFVRASTPLDSRYWAAVTPTDSTRNDATACSTGKRGPNALKSLGLRQEGFVSGAACASADGNNEHLRQAATNVNLNVTVHVNVNVNVDVTLAPARRCASRKMRLINVWIGVQQH
jgi:hypothetical protein